MIATITAATEDHIEATTLAGAVFELAYWAVPQAVSLGDLVALAADADGDPYVAAHRGSFDDVALEALSAPALGLWLHLYPEAPEAAKATVLRALRALVPGFPDPSWCSRFGLFAEDLRGA